MKSSTFLIQYLKSGGIKTIDKISPHTQIVVMTKRGSDISSSPIVSKLIANITDETNVATKKKLVTYEFTDRLNSFKKIPPLLSAILSS